MCVCGIYGLFCVDDAFTVTKVGGEDTDNIESSSVVQTITNKENSIYLFAIYRYFEKYLL